MSAPAAPHLAEHRPVGLEPLAEEGDELVLDFDELREHLRGPRRRHRSRIVTAHRKVAVTRHPARRRLELRGDLPVFRDEPAVRVAFLAGLRVAQIERLHVNVENFGHRVDELGKLRRERGALGETLAAGRLIYNHFIIRECTKPHAIITPRNTTTAKKPYSHPFGGNSFVK